jgi:murein DD-endopeptidase MepM/ murein hydrolase activator NlpD
VLAPAAGRVVSAVGDVADNPRPGQKIAGAPAPGNHVVIDHGKGEHSLVAHFRQGSLAVREGQKVKAGQLLGLCGNSGNSSQPHVHYHLQTGKRFGEGLGLPAFFNGYEADGEPVARGEPQRGQVVVPGE